MILSKVRPFLNSRLIQNPHLMIQTAWWTRGWSGCWNYDAANGVRFVPKLICICGVTEWLYREDQSISNSTDSIFMIIIISFSIFFFLIIRDNEKEWRRADDRERERNPGSGWKCVQLQTLDSTDGVRSCQPTDKKTSLCRSDVRTVVRSC